MLVLMPDPHGASQEFLVIPSAVPILSSVWLFLSGMAGLFGAARLQRQPHP